MRLVLVGPVHPFRGGIAHYTTVLNGELRRNGHDVLLISFRRQYPSWLFPGKTDRDPSGQGLPAPGARRILDPLNPLTWLKTVREIRAFGPETVVLQWWQAFWAPVWIVLEIMQRMARVPVTMICHNVLPHERRVWDVPLAKIVLGLADRTIVQSSSEEEELRRLLPRKAVDIACHPLYDMLAQEELSQGDARRRLGLSEAGPILLFFGFVREYKGLSYLIDALPAVLAAFPQARLIVAGEFWRNREQFESQIAGLGVGANVTLVDRYIPNEEVGQYFAAADLVTLPYASATQSGVLQLALGFSRPVLATRVGGLQDTVEEGDDVVFVEPRSAPALARAIIAFLESPLPHSVGASRAQSKRRWDLLVDLLTRDPA
jgi:glycosyltransferase involved in cell wall biosynthesis